MKLPTDRSARAMMIEADIAERVVEIKRQIRNEALEEAAKLVERAPSPSSGGWLVCHPDDRAQAARAIRGLRK